MSTSQRPSAPPPAGEEMLPPVQPSAPPPDDILISTQSSRSTTKRVLRQASQNEIQALKAENGDLFQKLAEFRQLKAAEMAKLQAITGGDQQPATGSTNGATPGPTSCSLSRPDQPPPHPLSAGGLGLGQGGSLADIADDVEWWTVFKSQADLERDSKRSSEAEVPEVSSDEDEQKQSKPIAPEDVTGGEKTLCLDDDGTYMYIDPFDTTSCIEIDSTETKTQNDDDDLVVVSEEDVNEAMGEFIAETLAKYPHVRQLSPGQMKHLLDGNFRHAEQESKLGKIWSWGQWMYTTYGWGAAALKIYQQPAMVYLVYRGISTAAKWALVLVL